MKEVNASRDHRQYDSIYKYPEKASRLVVTWGWSKKVGFKYAEGINVNMQKGSSWAWKMSWNWAQDTHNTCQSDQKLLTCTLEMGELYDM